MGSATSSIVPVDWNEKKGEVVWLDNAQIPWKEAYVSTKSIDRLALAIKKLEIRGAPVLGEAGAFGIALAANNAPDSKEEILRSVKSAAEILVKTRPTAVNLAWGINRLVKVVEVECGKDTTPRRIKLIAIHEAQHVRAENVAANARIGEFGKSLIHDGDVIMTVCNAGVLACDGIGTATAPLRAAWAEGKRFEVIATETRPLLQGSRLTAWELDRDGIPVRVVTDNAAAHVMKEYKVTKVLAGADRIVSTGHVFNKIGTFSLAILAHHFGNVEFYVAAPTSTIDPVTKWDQVRIEQRDPNEVKSVMGKVTIAPEHVGAINPAFDCTPPELITGIITELGIARAPYEKSLKSLISKEGSMV